MAWTKDNGKQAKLAAEIALLAGSEAQTQAERASLGADYIDEKKLLIEEFTGEQTNLQAQLDALVVDGDSSPEAAQARVGTDATAYATLKARLDAEQKKVTSQLADTVTEVNGVKPTNGKVTLPIPEIDTSKLATKTELSNVLDGSPKGAYDTLANLQTAFPTGTTGVYVVQADGHIYSWNGTTWADRGIYQSSGISDKSIGKEKLTFVPVIAGGKSGNLFDKSKTTSGRYTNATNGNLSANAVFSATDYIAVKPLTEYVFSTRGQMAWYDSNKVFIIGNAFGTGSNTQTGGVVVSPANASYLRTTFLSTDLSTSQVKEGTEIGGYEEYGVGYVTEENFTNDLKVKLNSSGLNSPLKGLKWNALGDSITFGMNATKPYPTVISERTGIIVRNYGISGTAITQKQDGSRPTAMCVRYIDMANDVDIITVLGGTNDFGAGVEIGTWNDGTNYTMYGGVKTLIEGLLTKYPTKRIGFISPLPRSGLNSPTSNLRNYINVIKDCCERFSIPYLNLYEGSGIVPGFEASKTATIPDGTHPNDAGHKIISYKIENFLLSI